MYRRPSRRSSGGRRGQPPQQPQNPYFPLQNPINTTYVYPSNPPFIPHNAYQNPDQIFPPSNFPTQTPNFSRQNPGFTPPSQLVSSSAVFQPQNSRDMLESIDRAVGKARHELAAAGENVSTWKVAQSTLLMLKVDSWDSLGFQMQQVPSLNVLMLTEAKINAFIHCFIGVQSITSLYDLEVAICKNERIKQFEDLGLGPLLRHPLVLHYFSVKSDTTKVYKITSGDITSLLSEFMDTSNNKMFSPEEILDFIVMKRSAASKEDLGIRIHSVENYISAIRKAKSLEKKSVKGFEKKIDAISMNSAISMLPNEVSNLLEDELSVDDNLKLIITHWKEACRERTVTEVLEMMLQYNNTKARKKKEIKKIKSMLSLYPLSGLLKVAVLSIKCGMWDIMCDTFQTGSLVDNCPEYVSIDVEQIAKDEPKMKDPRVITEHILEHTQNCSFKAALLDWALPYAQRYLHGVHPDKYSQLKQSEFEMLNRLQVVVVEKLFYRNVIKGTGSESKMQVECSCLLTGSVLYATQESDSHALFMELSRLFFNGSSELHLANFLHMITTMAESGSNEEQREFFILNSQKVPKLPDGESVWSLSSLHSLTRSDKPLQTSSTSTEVKEQSSWKSKSKAATWPPVDWKIAPGFGYARANYFKTQAPGSLAVQNKLGDDSEGISRQTDSLTPVSVYTNWTIEYCSAMSAALVLPDSNCLQEHCGEAGNEADLAMHIQFDPSSFGLVSDASDIGSSNLSQRDQLRFGTPNSTQEILTGRLGELVAFKYFVDKAGKSVVKWVNEHNETGLPYDIVLGEKENSREYIEVKATKSPRKDWFEISMREVQFAVEKGEAFSIAHVVLLDNNVARVSVFNNLANLCQLHKLRLAVLMPKQQTEFSIVSQS